MHGHFQTNECFLLSQWTLLLYWVEITPRNRSVFSLKCLDFARQINEFMVYCHNAKPHKRDTPVLRGKLASACFRMYWITNRDLSFWHSLFPGLPFFHSLCSSIWIASLVGLLYYSIPKGKIKGIGFQIPLNFLDRYGTIIMPNQLYNAKNRIPAIGILYPFYNHKLNLLKTQIPFLWL